MNTFRPIALAVVLGLGCGIVATPVLAQANGARAERTQQAVAQLEQRFKSADANADGQLTKDEAKDKMPRVYQHFDEIDAGKKGYLTLDEIKQYSAQAVAQRKGAR